MQCSVLDLNWYGARFFLMLLVSSDDALGFDRARLFL
jgi:hypothetical protein